MAILERYAFSTKRNVGMRLHKTPSLFSHADHWIGQVARTAISLVPICRLCVAYRVKVQKSQPIPAHIVLLMQVANTQGHGEEYCKRGPWISLAPAALDLSIVPRVIGRAEY